MDRVSNKKRSINFIGILFVSIFIFCSCYLIIKLGDFSNNFFDYQVGQINQLKSDINTAISSPEQQTEMLTQLENSYDFEVIIIKDNQTIYTSNNIYDIDQANSIFNNQYIYKETYQDGDYLVWLVVTSVDFVAFINQYLFIALVAVLILLICLVIFINYFYHKSSKPLLNVLTIIENLKNDGNQQITDQLDIVSQEILGMYNDLQLSSFIIKQQNTEQSRITELSKQLNAEQNDYLQTIIHDAKTPLAAIKYSSIILKQESLTPQGNQALTYIDTQVDNTLALLVDSLELIAENDSIQFVEIDEIDVRELIEVFTTNNQLSFTVNEMNMDLFPQQLLVLTNRLKFTLVLNNILSNMLNYGLHGSELSIKLENKKIVFTNLIGSRTNNHSTGLGKQFINGYLQELGISIEVIEDANKYMVILDLKDIYV